MRDGPAREGGSVEQREDLKRRFRLPGSGRSSAMFTVIPAIDLKDGKCVRLRQGRADDVTVYSADPVETARSWVREGAQWLHVVDLDGAFQGQPVHTDVVGRIAGAVPIPIELGGGLRTDDHLRAAIDAGVSRVILGTRAVREPDTLARLASEFGEALAVGIDARGGQVQVRGWVETTDCAATGLAATVSGAGVSTLIYTDTARDGMMGGPNVVSLEAVCRAARCDVIASGGITSARDIGALAALGRSNLVGAIVGKALYEQNVSLAALQSAAAPPDSSGDR